MSLTEQTRIMLNDAGLDFLGQLIRRYWTRYHPQAASNRAFPFVIRQQDIKS
jgi:hypothetical protein